MVQNTWFAAVIDCVSALIQYGETSATDATYRITSEVRCSRHSFQLLIAIPSSTGTANRVCHQPTVEPTETTNAARTSEMAHEWVWTQLVRTIPSTCDQYHRDVLPLLKSSSRSPAREPSSAVRCRSSATASFGGFREVMSSLL